MLLRFKNVTLIYSTILLGIFTLNITPTVSAANWPFAPYGFFQSGPVVALDFSESLKNKLSFQSTNILGGIGCLWSPAQLDNWLISMEGCYHSILEPSHRSAKEHGGFIVSKFSFPHAEGIESFLGVGLGGLHLLNLPEEQSANSNWPAALGTVGLNWHFNKGYYLSIKGLWIKPMGDYLTLQALRKQTVSLAVGIHWNWI